MNVKHMSSIYFVLFLVVVIVTMCIKASFRMS